MASPSAEHRYLTGYQAGHTSCLQTGSSDSGRRWAEAHQHADDAYLAGYEWALWDYEGANGMPHHLSEVS